MEQNETIQALRDGLADIRAGRYKPARATLKKLAREFGMATPVSEPQRHPPV